MPNNRAGRVKLEIDDIGSTIDELKGIAQRAKDGRPVMQSILKHMGEAQREHFHSEGGRGGVTWRPDTTEWILRKRSEGWSVKTLIRRGDLETSIMLDGGGEFGGEIRRAGRTSAVFGTSIYYAQFTGHNRILLYMTTDDMNLYGTKMVEWILSGNT